MDVILWRTGDFGGVGHHAEVARRRQAALPGVQHIQPSQRRIGGGVRRNPLDPASDLLVHAELGALPPVEVLLVRRSHVVKDNEYLRIRILEHGSRADAAARAAASARDPCSTRRRRRAAREKLKRHTVERYSSNRFAAFPSHAALRYSPSHG